MTTVYKYKKCNMFGFSVNIDNIVKKYKNYIIIDDNNKFTGLDRKLYKRNIKNFTDPDNFDSELIPTFIVDLTSKQFNDINILTEETDRKNNINNNEYKHEDENLKKIVTGKSTQLEAFTKNLYTVIYGKKTANVEQFTKNNHIFNHNIIDSLAKNGVISDQNSNEVLSVHFLFNELEKLRKFNIFFVHPDLDIGFVENDSPSEISHPVYIKGKGEITAIFYRTLVLKFFPYLTIVSEAMRENAYLF